MPIRILLLDRQVATRRMLRFALELQNVRIAEAGDAASALAILQREPVDLLVIGFESPDEEHVGMIDRARSLDGLGELPVLLVGDECHREFRNLRELGCCAWLDKPFRVTDVHERVRRLLDSIPRSAYPATNRNHGQSGV